MGGLAYPSLDAAIGQAEGFGKTGTIPTLANNPGDVIAGPFATAHGATGSITAANGQQIATFSNSDQGTAAEDALIANNYTGGSVQDLATSWLSGSSQAQQNQWASTVSNALGVPASTPVSSLAGGGSPQATGVSAPTSPGIVQSAMNAISSGATGFLGLVGLSIGREAAFILGLIVLGGAIFLFKPAQKVIIGAAKKGAAAVAV